MISAFAFISGFGLETKCNNTYTNSCFFCNESAGCRRHTFVILESLLEPVLTEKTHVLADPALSFDPFPGARKGHRNTVADNHLALTVWWCVGSFLRLVSCWAQTCTSKDVIPHNFLGRVYTPVPNYGSSSDLTIRNVVCRSNRSDHFLHCIVLGSASGKGLRLRHTPTLRD